MAEFTVNPNRHDPYKNFKFRVRWDGRYVAGVSKVSALKRTVEVVEHREGGDPNASRKSPGRTHFGAITLERGVTHDTEFEQWADKVFKLGAGVGAEVSLKDFRKDIVLEFYNEAGQLAFAYKVYRCWVSEYVALPDLVANASSVAIESIRLETRAGNAIRPSWNPPSRALDAKYWHGGGLTQAAASSRGGRITRGCLRLQDRLPEDAPGREWIGYTTAGGRPGTTDPHTDLIWARGRPET